METQTTTTTAATTGATTTSSSSSNPVFYGPECNADCPCYTQAATTTHSTTTTTTPSEPDTPPANMFLSFSNPPPAHPKLAFLDRFLTLWVLLAMVIGLLVGYFEPSVGEALQSVTVGQVSLPVAIGLILMMLPVFAKVPFENLRRVVAEDGGEGGMLRQQVGLSMVLNWVVGPLLMTALGWAMLPDLPEYRAGLILVGLARCIAMVALWNTLAGGSITYCAILIALNSLFQIITYSPLAALLIGVLSSDSTYTNVALFFWEVTQSVLVFLGIPLVVGLLLRYGLRSWAGPVWFDTVFMPRFSPCALLGLLYTIVVLFCVQGRVVINNIGAVARVAVPMFCYFNLMFFSALYISYRLKFPYSLAVTQAFTAASNNFELAIAIAVATFGVTSPAAIAATVGPLLEVPVLLALVYVVLAIRGKWDRWIGATPVAGRGESNNWDDGGSMVLGSSGNGGCVGGSGDSDADGGDGSDVVPLVSRQHDDDDDESGV